MLKKKTTNMKYGNYFITMKKTTCSPQVYFFLILKNHIYIQHPANKVLLLFTLVRSCNSVMNEGRGLYFFLHQ